MIKRLLVWVGSWMIAAYVFVLRTTCRVELGNDQRESLRANGHVYLFSFFHSQQLASTAKSEPGTGAMVSRSLDGQLIVPALKVCGCIPVRGSKWRPNQTKGGREAVDALTEHILSGHPVAIAVDGPRGPRGRVHKGIVAISQRTGAAIINVVAVPSYRIVIRRSWDQMQIPLPFTRIVGAFADPIFPEPGEKLEAYRRRVEQSLHALEREFDPEMAKMTLASSPLSDNEDEGDVSDSDGGNVRQAA